MPPLAKLAEGKTKIIWQNPDDMTSVHIESKDTITAGDGARQNVIPGKGVLANQTTCNCFELLRRRGIPNHYRQRGSANTFEATRVKMIPIELVARRLATGSYLKRNPDVTEGTRFNQLVIEHFYKDDANNDPLMVYDFDRGVAQLHDPKYPIGEKILREEPLADGIMNPKKRYHDINLLLQQVFEWLEWAWNLQKVTLVDLKIECGYEYMGNQLLVADVIDNDSWRLWPGGDKGEMLDKQVYRDLSEVTDDALRLILAKYQTVASLTKNFVS